MNKTEEWTYHKCVYHEFFFNYPHIDSKKFAIMENLPPNLNDSKMTISNSSLYDHLPNLQFYVLRMLFFEFFEFLEQMRRINIEASNGKF